MNKCIAIALAAGALAAPVAAFAQAPAGPPPVVYAVPAPQSGVSYYCANPQGWYPAMPNCSVAWVAYSQQPVVQVVPGVAPTPQAGVSYWCANPQGWYPGVQRCSVAWAPYAQPSYVVSTAPSYVVVQPPPAFAADPASAVYYVGPHRNAPYQSGILP